MDNATFELEFSAQGSVRQTVKITALNVTPNDIIWMLKSGEAATTIQEDGTINIVASGKPIATIENVDNELEYFDYAIVDKLEQ